MNQLMKRAMAVGVATVMAASSIFVWAPQKSYADIPHIEGGVSGDVTLKAGVYQYDEMTFISGTPIQLTGTVTVPTTIPTTNKYKLTYTYDLQNTDSKAVLSRKITYDVEKVQNQEVNQTTYKMTVSKLDETYTIDSVVYTLGTYTINKSILEDNTPAVNYYSGSTYVKRIFYRNGDAKSNSGKITIESNSDTLVGYKHRWGNSETQIVNEKLKGEIVTAASGSTAASTSIWNGSATIKMNVVEKTKFDYVKTETQNISFKGNYRMVRQQENLLQYTYDLPTVSSSTYSDKVRSKGEKNIKRSAILDNTALITPKIRDITGHWAQNQIILATSLELFSPNASYFAPNDKITRRDFFKALVKVVSNVKPLTNAELIKRNRGAGTPPPFQDVSVTDPDISFYEYAKNNNMIIGENKDFLGDKPISRAEMITAIINTLGIANMAPQPPYKTEFVDDGAIPFWAKDAIYMANEVNLVNGYADGSIKPNDYVTRGEAAAMLTKFIDHIRETISYEYRDQLINR